MNETVLNKLNILADAAKYDVSCSSSGSSRSNTNGGIGSAASCGICHSFTEDGRCISLLKILYTNFCVYNCAYCVNRRSNDVKRVAFTVQEVVDLTINFYRRNYIEGLFLSSGIFKNADYTMERLVLIAKKLRTEERFNGYIHLKTIPGAAEELMQQAGLYADRLSVNIEMPTRESLALLAPDKKREDVLKPMTFLNNQIVASREERKIIKRTPVFAPAGQSTQMVIGATPENDLQILWLTNQFYKKLNLKRVYYSGYVPVSNDNRLPAIGTPVPMVRENRLYQADWLLRFYKFNVEEIVDRENPLLDLELDPKLNWALRNLHMFPVNINTADYHLIMRVPGIGVQSAQKICAARKYAGLTAENLKKLGIAYNRARHFIVCSGAYTHHDVEQYKLRQIILKEMHSKYKPNFSTQMTLF